MDHTINIKQYACRPLFCLFTLTVNNG